MAGCQFSMSAGGPDYKKLENAISDNLNENYQTFNKQVIEADDCVWRENALHLSWSKPVKQGFQKVLAICI